MFFLYLKAFHIICMTCWFAGLFYLPRLFVYHALSSDEISHKRFLIMERKLFYGIMTPSAVLTAISGILLLQQNFSYYQNAHWMWIKLICVILLIIYHIFCAYYYLQFKQNKNQHGHIFYRFFNELPVLALILIVSMVIIKPSF